MSKPFLKFLIAVVTVIIVGGLIWLITSRALDRKKPNATAAIINSPTMTISATPTTPLPREQAITVIPLTGPAAESRSEISGMAWYNDTLILLPQYPSRFRTADGVLFGIKKADILAFLDGSISEPLLPTEIPLIAPQVERIDGFEGFEAIAFSGDQVYLTIEAKPSLMMGYLIMGSINPSLKELHLDLDSLKEIPPQSQIDNMTYEALLVTSNSVLSFFEANGLQNNPSPYAQAFTLAGEHLQSIPMDHLEYRLTDVTPLDSDNHFWGINYFFPGDTKLTPKDDPLAIKHGEGPSHAASIAVERLIQFHYSTDGIAITDTPPIQLQLLPDDEARNWEALARLDQRGFLLATDKFPHTILAFVSTP